MSVQELAYLANIRLPTEKAHGFQICKMCEAFALQNTAVSLYHPKRYQSAALNGKIGQDSFDYYGIQPNFNIHTTPNLDIIRLETLLPRKLYRGAYQVHAALWAKLSARRINADIYYTRDFEIANVLTQMNLPTVLEAHAVPKGRNYRVLEATVKRPSFRLGVVLTQFIRKALVEAGAPSSQVIVEPDAVDLSQFTDLPTTEEAKKQVGLPTDRPIVGYIGRFSTMGMDKGIKPLIEMMAQLKSLNAVEPLLVCVGGPLDQIDEYYSLAAQLGVPKTQLRFIDRVPNKEVPLWISAIDIATMPYPFTEHYAYFMSPMKLFEYLAAGKAIVSTDLPSIQEVMVDGHNGRLVPHDEPKAFAYTIIELLNNPNLKAKLEKQARSDAQAYSWRARAQRILGALNG